MKKSIFTIMAILLMATVNYSVQAQSLDNVLDKHFKAIGQEKLVAVKTFTIKAKMSMMGMEIPMNMKMKNPNKFRVETEMQGQKMVQAYDGEKGWMIMPMMGPGVMDLSGDQLNQAIKQANMEGDLYHYEKKGHTAELIGKVNADGKEAYRVKLALKDGTVMNYFMDANTYLIIKVKSKMEVNGQSIDVEQKMLEYKTIDGITMAMKTEGTSPMGTQTVEMEEIKFNEKIDDSIFAKPAE